MIRSGIIAGLIANSSFTMIAYNIKKSKEVALILTIFSVPFLLLKGSTILTTDCTDTRSSLL